MDVNATAKSARRLSKVERIRSEMGRQLGIRLEGVELIKIKRELEEISRQKEPNEM